MMDLASTPAVALLCLVALATFTVEATVGFGGTVLIVTIAALFLPIETILAVTIPTGLLLSAYLALRGRRHVELRLLATRILPFMLAGMPVGILLFNMKSNLWLKRGFGLFVAALAGVELAALVRGRALPADEIEAASDDPAPDVPAPDIPAPDDAGPDDAGPDDAGPDYPGEPEATRRLGRGARSALLLGAGIIHGIYGSGGPLAVYVVSRDVPEKARFRATLSTLWLALNVVLVSNYAIEGLLTPTTLRASGVLVVPMVGGIFLGEWIHSRVNLSAFRVAVFSLLLVGGVLILVTA